MKGKYIRELCLPASPLTVAGLYALPASTTALESNPKNRPRRTAVRDKPLRLATCLDRSVAASGAIASTVSPRLPWRKLLSPTERLPLVERPRRRAAPAVASGYHTQSRVMAARGGKRTYEMADLDRGAAGDPTTARLSFDRAKLIALSASSPPRGPELALEMFSGAIRWDGYRRAALSPHAQSRDLIDHHLTSNAPQRCPPRNQYKVICLQVFRRL